MDARKNFAIGTLASGINDSATTLSVGSGEGARFPAPPFSAVIFNRADYLSPAHAYHGNQAEIVRVTGISTDTLTIVRAREGTSARNLNTGGKTYEIWAGPTVGYWDDSVFNPSNLIVVDDFVMGSNTTQNLGKLGWRLQNIGSGQSTTGVAGVWPYLGIVGISGTASGAGVHMTLGINNNPFSDMTQFTNWEMYWIVQFTNAASIRFRAGLYPWGDVVASPANGIGLRFDTNIGDTNFKFDAVASSTSSPVDSGVTPNTSFFKFRLRSTETGKVRFSLNDGSETEISSGLPTAALSPTIICVSDTSATRTAQIDYFSMQVKGLAR